jgi:hypothetical protein
VQLFFLRHDPSADSFQRMAHVIHDVFPDIERLALSPSSYVDPSWARRLNVTKHWERIKAVPKFTKLRNLTIVGFLLHEEYGDDNWITHYPAIQTLPPSLECLELWTYFSGLSLMEDIYRNRARYPLLRKISVRVPVAKAILYERIRDGLRKFVKKFRTAGILLQFCHEELLAYPTLEGSSR